MLNSLNQVENHQIFYINLEMFDLMLLHSRNNQLNLYHSFLRMYDMNNNLQKYFLTLKYADDNTEQCFYHIVNAANRVEVLKIAEQEIDWKNHSN